MVFQLTQEDLTKLISIQSKCSTESVSTVSKGGGPCYAGGCSNTCYGACKGNCVYPGG